MSLLKNEIITLNHLADGKQADEIPEGLSEAQYFTAARSLQEKDMVYAAFVEGGKLEALKLTMKGQAEIDDKKEEAKRIYRHLAQKAGLTTDQLALMQHAKKMGQCDNIFNIPWAEYRDYIFKDLYNKHYLKTDYDKNRKQRLVLTRLGQQVVDDIEDDFYTELSNHSKKYNIQQEYTKIEDDNTGPSQKIKYSGFGIDENRITDVIKVVWSMHSIGMFVKPDGKKATIQSVMDAFAEFLQSKQFKQYSSYTNKGQKATKNTYLSVFEEMKDAAEKYYDKKEERKISK